MKIREILDELRELPQVIKEEWDKIINGSDKEQETEFLPAILEVTETPPSPVGRLVMWSILALLTVGLLWACFGKINEVAVAEGKIIPKGQVKTVQVKNKGIVKEINVKEGDSVKKGQKLVVLDPTTTAADLDSLRKRGAYYKMDVDRLECELAGKPFTPPKDDPNIEPRDISAELTLYISRTGQHRAEVAQAEAMVAQKQAQLAAERVNLQKYAEMLEIEQDKERRLEVLIEQNAIALFQLIEQRSKRMQTEKALEAQNSVIVKAEGELAEAELRLENVKASYNKDVMQQLVESRKQYLAYAEEIKKADENQRLSTITAPCDGRVYNLSVHTVGGIVTDAQPLLMVVPDDVELELEVWADNKDIGFIKEDMEAEVKVATFNFQKYGFVKAKVSEISADAYNDKQDPAKDKKYRLALKVVDDNINVFGQKAQLIPGMQVTAEIKIKDKRIIEYFLDPFRRYTHDSLRER